MLVILSETQEFDSSGFYPVCVFCNFGSLAFFFRNVNRITVQRAQATGKKFFQYIRTEVLNFGIFALFQRTTPKWTSRAYPNFCISQKIGEKRKNNGNSVGKYKAALSFIKSVESSAGFRKLRNPFRIITVQWKDFEEIGLERSSDI